VAAVRGLLLLGLLAPACAALGRGSKPGTIPVRFGDHVLTVEVAATESEREHGLMFRRDLGADDGMIFVFETAHQASFWMKDTPTPLSIAFLDADKKVLNVEAMAAYDDQSMHLSKGDALYAVEAKQGWFEKNGVKAGDTAQFELPVAKER
jgi:uncharacterized membrane protein (UPF0127 family)